MVLHRPSRDQSLRFLGRKLVTFYITSSVPCAQKVDTNSLSSVLDMLDPSKHFFTLSFLISKADVLFRLSPSNRGICATYDAGRAGLCVANQVWVQIETMLPVFSPYVVC